MHYAQQSQHVALLLMIHVAAVPIHLSAADTNARAHTITLTDGRQLSGDIDVQSNDEHLWVRRVDRGIVIVSGIRWDRIVHVQTPDGPTNPSELRAQLTNVVTAGPGVAKLLETATDVPAKPISSPSTPRVETMLIRAELAQWDNDVQPDGILVSIIPSDRDGRLVPVRGDVELTLHGMTDDRVTRQRPRVIELERVSHLVSIEDFQNGPAVYRLPFDKFAPDLALDIVPVAVLHARLGVNGQGAFEASDPNVCLRPGYEFRDHLQLHTGKRFLAVESAGEANR